MAEIERKPAIRFAGFTNAWEQHKLGDVGGCQSGVGFPDAEQGGSLGIPFYKVSDMNNTGNEHEMVNSNNYVTAEQIQRNGWKPITQVPAMVFAKVGAAVMLNRKRLAKKPFLLDNNSMTYMFDSSWNEKYGQALFETIYLPSLVQVGALPSYNANQVEGIEIFKPDYPEQTKVGELFNNLDNLITLHQRKCDKLINVKKSLLEKMFPVDGESAPKIRFKGYTNAWEQREINELIIKGGSGGTPLSSNPLFYNGNIPFLGISDITNSDGYIYDTEKHITDEGLKNSSAWIVPKESISLAMYASVGKVAILKENIATSQAFYNMVFSNLTDRDITYHRLKKMEIWEEWDSLISTGTQANLNAEKVKSLKLTIPKEEKEKNNISTLLNNLDSLITLHQRKCEKLINIKKSLLEKMFI